MKDCKHCNIEHDMKGNVCRVCKDGMYRYGMNRLDMISLHESQNKKCLLCEKEVEMFTGHKGGMIDHNHETGKVRSILCNRCNTVVGGFESHNNKKKLLEYLGVV